MHENQVIEQTLRGHRRQVAADGRQLRRDDDARDARRRVHHASSQGLKVIIAEGECQLERQRRVQAVARARSSQRGRRVVRVKYGVDEDTCSGDHSCIRLSGCPTLSVKAVVRSAARRSGGDRARRLRRLRPVRRERARGGAVPVVLPRRGDPESATGATGWRARRARRGRSAVPAGMSARAAAHDHERDAPDHDPHRRAGRRGRRRARRVAGRDRARRRAIRRRARRSPASRSAPARRPTTSRCFPRPSRRSAAAGRCCRCCRCRAASTSLVASELLEAGRIVAERHGERRTGRCSSRRRSRTLTTAEKMALGDGRFDSGPPARRRARAQREARRVRHGGGGARRGDRRERRDVRRDRRQRRAAVRRARRSRRSCARRDAAPTRASPDSRAAGTRCGADAARRAAHARADAAFRAARRPDPGAGCARVSRGDPRPRRRRGLRAPRRVPGRRLRRPLPRAARAGRSRRSGAAIRPAAHGQALTRETGALSRAVDGVRRRRPRRRAQERARAASRGCGAKSAARDGDVVRIVDYFKPGVPECRRAAAGVARGARGSPRGTAGRQARGQAPWSLAAARCAPTASPDSSRCALLASLKGLRRRGARYAQEQAAIERWLGAIARGAERDWACGFELALCGRLVKGYGATNERGKRNLAHIVEHLADGGAFATPAAARRGDPPGARGGARRRGRHGVRRDAGRARRAAAAGRRAADPLGETAPGGRRDDRALSSQRRRLGRPETATARFRAGGGSVKICRIRAAAFARPSAGNSHD